MKCPYCNQEMQRESSQETEEAEYPGKPVMKKQTSWTS